MNHAFIHSAPQNTTFDQCIKCTVCTVYCPVAKANPTIRVLNSVAQMVSVYGSKVPNIMMTRSSCVPTANAVKPPALQASKLAI